MNTKGLLCIQAVVVSMLHSLLRTRTFSQSCTGPEPVYSREIINKYGIIMVGSDDRKPRLFLFKDASKGAQFGVGTYIDILAKQAIKTGMDVKIVHLVPENNQPDGKKTSHHDIILKYQPPDHEPDKSSDVIDKENARILYSKFKPFLSQGTNIFHFNSTLYVFNFIEILKSQNDGKIVFTYHKLTWKYYKNCQWQDFLFFLHDRSNLHSRIVKKMLILEKSVCDMSDQIICLTHQSYEYIRDFYETPESKLSLIRNGIDINRNQVTHAENKNQLKRNLNLTKGERLILFAGRIEPEKGVFLLLKAFEKLLESISNVRLLVAGDGLIREMALACPVNVAGRISFTGFICQNELNRLYRISDVGVIPSYNEEISYTALEMMKNKLPLVCTDSGGLGEIFEDNVSAKLVRTFYDEHGNLTFNHEELSKELVFLINNDQVKTNFAENAYNTLNNQYSVQQMTNKTFQIYYR